MYDLDQEETGGGFQETICDVPPDLSTEALEKNDSFYFDKTLSTEY